MKDTARLTARLLVRKGDAAPALMPETRLGYFPSAPQRRATVPGAHRRISSSGGDKGPEATSTAENAAPAGASGARVAMTLRLDSERHLRLKILAAHEHRSCQSLLLEALDALVEKHRHASEACACLQENGKSGDGRANGSAPRRRVRAG